MMSLRRTRESCKERFVRLWRRNGSERRGVEVAKARMVQAILASFRSCYFQLACDFSTSAQPLRVGRVYAYLSLNIFASPC